jgi:hypothetical protein
MIGIGRRKVTNLLLAFLGNGRFFWMDGATIMITFTLWGGRRQHLCKVTTGLGSRWVFGVFLGWDGELYTFFRKQY